MVENVEKRMEASDTYTSLGNSGLERNRELHRGH